MNQAHGSAQRQFRLIVFGVMVTWVAVSIVAAVAGRSLPVVEQPAFVHFALGLHSDSQGWLPVQLLAYSFIHNLGVHLIFSLLLFWAFSQLAREFMTPAAFVRLLSLSGVGSGLVYLGISQLAGNSLPVIGGGGQIMALLGACAVMTPQERVYPFGITSITMCWLMCWFLMLVTALEALSFRSNPALCLLMLSGAVIGVAYTVLERTITGMQDGWRKPAG